MELKAYAKINLYLDVTAKRENGYHEILSIMQTVDLCDTVRVQCCAQEPAGIALHCDWDLPCDSRNLAYRAADAYFAGNPPCKIEIDVQKRIPMQAGLAGGSADCAAVLRALNALYQKYSESELLMLGARLGADVPFCLVGGTRITRGIGEIMQPCAAMPECFLVIARGGEGISTPWAYGALDDEYGNFAGRERDSEQKLAGLTAVMQEGHLGAMATALYNIFESVVLPEHEVARNLKAQMLTGGAIGAIMSGSGPSVVGIFTDEKTAQRVRDAVAAQGIAAFVCRPIQPN